MRRRWAGVLIAGTIAISGLFAQDRPAPIDLGKGGAPVLPEPKPLPPVVVEEGLPRVTAVPVPVPKEPIVVPAPVEGVGPVVEMRVVPRAPDAGVGPAVETPPLPKFPAASEPVVETPALPPPPPARPEATMPPVLTIEAGTPAAPAGATPKPLPREIEAAPAPVPPLKEFSVPKPRPVVAPEAAPAPVEGTPAVLPAVVPPTGPVDGPQPQFRPASNVVEAKVKPRPSVEAATAAQTATPPTVPQRLPDLLPEDPVPAIRTPPDATTPPTVVGPYPPVRPSRHWVRGEYLMWWVKDTPLNFSLVATDNINNPGTELLDSERCLGTFSGLRLSGGWWFSDDQLFGVDASWFYLDRRHSDFNASSDATGYPMLVLPFISNAPGTTGAYALPISTPGTSLGSIQISSALSLWGGEVNGAVCLFREPGLEIVALAGFRYADLIESLNISSLSTDITTNPRSVSYLSDGFNTRNQFYGGQVAGRVSWGGSMVSLDLTGKLAIGSTHNTIDIQGTSSQFGPNLPNGYFPNGFFAQPTNIGRYSGNKVTFMPSLEARLNLQLTPRVRTFVGYDFLYWSQVVRPGSQIDRTLNLTQSATIGTGTLNGPASPGPQFNRTDFWTHGVSFGFEVRF